MRAVNLLPRDVQRESLAGARIPLFVAAAGVVAVTAGAMLLSSSAAGTADDRRAELAAVEAEIARVPRASVSALTQGALVQERTDRVTALAAALSTRVAFDRLLRDISFVLPEDAWLTQLEATAPVRVEPEAEGGAPPPQAPAASEGVIIQGATYSHDTVALVLSRLGVVPSLENVRLTASARVEPQTEAQSTDGEPSTSKRGRPFVTFVVSASLRTGAS